MHRTKQYAYHVVCDILEASHGVIMTETMMQLNNAHMVAGLSVSCRSSFYDSTKTSINALLGGSVV